MYIANQIDTMLWLMYEASQVLAVIHHVRSSLPCPSVSLKFVRFLIVEEQAQVTLIYVVSRSSEQPLTLR